MKNHFFLMLLMTSLQGCVGNNSCRQIKLLQEEKVWYNFYKVGDTLIFGNSKNRKEFVLKDKAHDFTPCAKFELGPNTYEYQGVLLKSNTFEININFTKESQNDESSYCNKMIHVSDLYTDDLTNLMMLDQEQVFIPYLNKSIATFKITEDKFTMDIDGGGQMVKSFNWSKKYGVVRYTRYNDEVFTLLKKK